MEAADTLVWNDKIVRLIATDGYWSFKGELGRPFAWQDDS